MQSFPYWNVSCCRKCRTECQSDVAHKTRHPMIDTTQKILFRSELVLNSKVSLVVKLGLENVPTLTSFNRSSQRNATQLQSRLYISFICTSHIVHRTDRSSDIDLGYCKFNGLKVQSSNSHVILCSKAFCRSAFLPSCIYASRSFPVFLFLSLSRSFSNRPIKLPYCYCHGFPAYKVMLIFLRCDHSGHSQECTAVLSHCHTGQHAAHFCFFCWIPEDHACLSMQLCVHAAIDFFF